MNNEQINYIDESKDEVFDENEQSLPPLNDWQKRHLALEQERDAIRERVRQTKSGRGIIRFAKPNPKITDLGEKRVGVYARVSTKSAEQVSSIENQTKYYTKRVADNPQWTLHKIYSDEGKSGTSTKKRVAFKEMIQAAKNKEIDIILCASVSRLARNMVDCMKTIRKLRTMNPSHPVGVYFETENIYTLDPDSNQQLNIHAMLAEWESASKSARMILSYDQRIITGQYPVSDLLGYRHTKEGGLEIVPEEAKTVRFIYLAYLCGYSLTEIAEILTERARPTLKGRTTWNASMVRSIMDNERRWGDLDVRKTIVIDYVDHVSKKNEDERVSAYEAGHHEAIVSPEIARAAKMMHLSSKSLRTGVSDIMVIPEGGLKGFVSINPKWGGVDHNTFMKLSSEVYSNDELEEVVRAIRIWNGEEHSKVLSLDFNGYIVPRGIYFLTRNMPSITINRSGLKFSKACLKKLGNCKYIELLYHPILRTIVIRTSDKEAPNSIAWEKDNGEFVSNVPAKAFSKAIYENMRWREDLGFQFRGIFKERGNQKILVFALDEPRIIPSAKAKAEMSFTEEERNTGVKYIPYRVDDEGDTAQGSSAQLQYPAEWQGMCGIGYAFANQRDSVFRNLTQADIVIPGVIMTNPLIGVIPPKTELQCEVQELLMCM